MQNVLLGMHSGFHGLNYVLRCLSNFLLVIRNIVMSLEVFKMNIYRLTIQIRQCLFIWHAIVPHFGSNASILDGTQTRIKPEMRNCELDKVQIVK